MGDNDDCSQRCIVETLDMKSLFDRQRTSPTVGQCWSRTFWPGSIPAGGDCPPSSPPALSPPPSGSPCQTAALLTRRGIPLTEQKGETFGLKCQNAPVFLLADSSLPHSASLKSSYKHEMFLSRVTRPGAHLRDGSFALRIHTYADSS